VWRGGCRRDGTRGPPRRRSRHDRMKNWLLLAWMLVLPLQWMIVRMAGVPLSEPNIALLAGVAIFGSAFLLSWAAELAQLEVSQTLALAVLALIAVLPEYAVDMYFAWQGGKDPVYAGYATANMTGANRLLIGIGWSGVVITAWWRQRVDRLVLPPAMDVEMRYLGLATLYAFVIPLKGTLSIIDSIVFLAIFGLYVRAGAQAQVIEPELEGPARRIAALSVGKRRAFTVFLFLYAAVAILISAEPFAESLLATGRHLGVEEFILVQWIAPLVSEAPELIVAILFVLRGRAAAGMGTLLSSKVNQWTLLVGMIPAAYSLSAGHASAMPLDERQIEEMLLTAAQSLFAIAIISNLQFGVVEAAVLVATFVPQPFFTSPISRYVYSGFYVAGFLVVVALSGTTRRACWALVRGWRRAVAPPA
jgi:cation:H+ antiporter